MSPVDGMSDEPPFLHEDEARSLSPPAPMRVSTRVPPQPVASTSRVQLPSVPAPRPTAVSTPSSSASSMSATVPVVGTLVPRPVQTQQPSRGRGFPSSFRSSYRHQFMNLAARRGASNTSHDQSTHGVSPTVSGSREVVEKVHSPASSEHTSNADASSAQESMPDPVPDSEAPSSRVTSKSASDSEERTQRAPMSVDKGGKARLPASPILASHVSSQRHRTIHGIEFLLSRLGALHRLPHP